MNKPRLIDANKYKEYLIETASTCEGLGMHELGMMNRNLAQMVDNIPTAYDVEAVVEKLEELKRLDANSIRYLGFCYRCTWKVHNGAIDKAIEIVKGNGNENSL